MDVVRILSAYGISTHGWGKGSAKTVEHLQREVDAGESVLRKENGSLIRCIATLCLNVFCVFDGTLYRLREDRQEFADGRVRRRNFFLCSVAEKLHADEKAGTASAIRALSEELGLENFEYLKWEDVRTETKDSPGYPGLKARLVIYQATVYLREADFNPDGYVEVQEDKSTYFVWDKEE